MAGFAAPAGVTGWGEVQTNTAARFILTPLLVWSLWGCGTAETLSESDYRTVPYESLVHTLDHFSKTGVYHFTEILFDVQRYQVIVGAEGALFRLSLDSLRELEMAEWKADLDKVAQCEYKGQPEELCKNFIKVLVSYQDQVFACGTYAFKPKCTWRDPTRLSTVTQKMDGVGRCPYNPWDNTTALITKDGNIFTGTALDPQSQKTAILRMAGHDSSARSIRTPEAYDSKWLAQPDFVAQFETDKFVYFIYREAAVEFINCGKAIYSRIARVCKDDRGGSSLLKEKWTTFLKARLNCSLPGNYPFYFDQVQDAVFVKDEGMVYATFNTGQNSISGAAVCNFNLTAIEQSFVGDFKHQSGPAAIWSPESNNNNEHFECRREATSDDLLVSQKYQLVDKSVHSSTLGPVFREDLTRFNKIAVDTVFVKSQDRQPVHVMFISTEEGSIKKISHNPTTGQTCLVEVLWPFPNGHPQQIRTMKFLGNTASLYLTTDEGVIKIPVQRCSRFQNRKQCLNAMDPYCGWNKQKHECVIAPNKNPRVASWEQIPISCPILTDAVEGGWSEWSTWDQCAFNSPSSRINSVGDFCKCRKRICDSPTPAFGGSMCQGTDLIVTNCTQHGQWTDWSEWSGCSQTCGVGMKRRQRTCGNPEPAYGGSVCIGRDSDEQYCDDLPKCASHRASTSYIQPAATPTWSEWSDWTECSAKCGQGFKSRKRKCYGTGCQGCDQDWEECENGRCNEYVDVTDWTPWMNATGGDRGGWIEKRFTFTHQSPVNMNKAGRIREERRYCYAPDNCNTIIGPTSSSSPSNTEDFSKWSSCSASCGGGRQFKIRLCSNGSTCSGTSLVEQACNTQSCEGAWGCWSSWSECENRVKSRERSCEVAGGGQGAAKCSKGDGSEEVPCETRQGVWAIWGPCQQGGQSRVRHNEGGGRDTEMRQCGAGLSGGRPVPREGEDDRIRIIVGAFVIALVVGVCAGAGLMYYYMKYKKPASVTSPHYISAKSQNLYVSLPMLDLKHKQLNSKESEYGGTLRSNSGTMRSKTGSSLYGNTVKPGDYDTATIKRSHSRRDSSMGNGGSTIRADLDSDQMFT